MIETLENKLTHARDYRIVPMASDQADDAVILRGILREEADATPDPKRRGFYWVGSGGSRYYVNVHDALETIYLVSVEGGRLREAAPAAVPAPSL
jgi:hypothetical protein